MHVCECVCVCVCVYTGSEHDLWSGKLSFKKQGSYLRLPLQQVHREQVYFSNSDGHFLIRTFMHYRFVANLLAKYWEKKMCWSNRHDVRKIDLPSKIFNI